MQDSSTWFPELLRYLMRLFQVLMLVGRRLVVAVTELSLQLQVKPKRKSVRVGDTTSERNQGGKKNLKEGMDRKTCAEAEL